MILSVPSGSAYVISAMSSSKSCLVEETLRWTTSASSCNRIRRSLTWDISTLVNAESRWQSTPFSSHSTYEKAVLVPNKLHLTLYIIKLFTPWACRWRKTTCTHKHRSADGESIVDQKWFWTRCHLGFLLDKRCNWLLVPYFPPDRALSSIDQVWGFPCFRYKTWRSKQRSLIRKNSNLQRQSWEYWSCFGRFEKSFRNISTNLEVIESSNFRSKLDSLFQARPCAS